MSRTPNDDRSDGMNLNNPQQWANEANRLNQMGYEDDCSAVGSDNSSFWRLAEPIFPHPFPPQPIKDVFLVIVRVDENHARRMGYSVHTFDLDKTTKEVEQVWQQKENYLYLCLFHGDTVLCERRRSETSAGRYDHVKEAARFVEFVRCSENRASTFYQHSQNLPCTMHICQLLGIDPRNR